MNKLQKRRLYYIAIIAIVLSMAMGLILYALKQNINAFFTPNQLTNITMKPDQHFRLGGLVKNGSVIREKNNLGVHFIVTDYKRDLPVYYVGILPDLFHEGKGVIAEGSINQDGTFIATQVLARHDENYMPKNVYQALRANQESK